MILCLGCHGRQKRGAFYPNIMRGRRMILCPEAILRGAMETKRYRFSTWKKRNPSTSGASHGRASGQFWGGGKSKKADSVFQKIRQVARVIHDNMRAQFMFRETKADFSGRGACHG
ncbi:hypothetical protein AVEN_141861-1 [Araneus ventricosus]|uniref:Uncharacterized protein n=1 Tax=Araneus ventricosus TaxID=182803 RepID=A0A4Y2L2L9_ARAVE|nr:hypothetical protein AVEN_141861-1 [Araneus ventricosus]